MGLLDDDLAFILADQQALTGQGAVRWSGKSFTATFDDADEVVTDSAGQQLVQLGGMVLRCRTQDLPTGAGMGQNLTVDGVNYKARQLLKQDEGRITMVWISPT